MKLTISLLTILSLTFSSANAAEEYMIRLDHAINDFETYHQKKEAGIDSLKRLLANAGDNEAKYYIAMDLYRDYQTYDLDSALVYVDFSLSLAEKLKNNERIMDTRIAQAFLYLYMGMYMEAHDIFRELDINGCSYWLKRAYYHLGMNLFQKLSIYSMDGSLKDAYVQRTMNTATPH